MAGTKKKRRLGRGLGSLMTQPVSVQPGSEKLPVNASLAPSEFQHDQAAGPAIVQVPVADVVPNRHQPRQDFDPDRLAELAASIKAAGVMQPILIRQLADDSADGRYELIAGERRLRAARLVPLETIPAIVHEVSHREAAEWALIENLQREDLNPIDRAEAFKALLEEHEITHAELADRVGLSRSSVTNLLRLNDLEPSVSNLVRRGELSLGHAKVLVGIGESAAQARLAAAAVSEQMSVRELERRAAIGQAESPAESPAMQAAAAPKERTHLDELQERLGAYLGTRTLIRKGRKTGSGKIIVEFYSLDEFDGIMQRIGFDPE